MRCRNPICAIWSTAFALPSTCRERRSGSPCARKPTPPPTSASGRHEAREAALGHAVEGALRKLVLVLGEQVDCELGRLLPDGLGLLVGQRPSQRENA